MTELSDLPTALAQRLAAVFAEETVESFTTFEIEPVAGAPGLNPNGLKQLLDQVTAYDKCWESQSVRVGSSGPAVRFQFGTFDDETTMLATVPDSTKIPVKESLRNFYNGHVNLPERTSSRLEFTHDPAAEDTVCMSDQLSVSGEREEDVLIEGYTLPGIQNDEHRMGLITDEIESRLSDVPLEVITEMTVVPVGSLSRRIDEYVTTLEQGHDRGFIMNTIYQIVHDEPPESLESSDRGDLSLSRRNRIEELESTEDTPYCVMAVRVAAVVPSVKAPIAERRLNDIGALLGAPTNQYVQPDFEVTRGADAQPMLERVCQPEPAVTAKSLGAGILSNTRSTLLLTPSELGIYIGQTADGKGDSGTSHTNTSRGHRA